MPPNAMKFVRTVTKPSNGARTRRLSMLRSATCTDSCALLRFSRRPSAEALVVSRCVFDVGFELREPLLRLVERQHVLLGLDRAHQLVALDIQLGAADVVARVQQRDFVVRRLNRRLRVGLDDLLLRELQIESRLFEVEFLLGGIEFEDDVAGLERAVPSRRASGSAAARPSAERSAASRARRGDRRRCKP